MSDGTGAASGDGGMTDPPGAADGPGDGSTRASLWRWLAAWAVVLVLVVGVLFTAATARLFLWPPSDAPAQVDAIVALGGDPGQLRAKEAVSLAEQGYASVVLVSRGGYPPAPCPTVRAGIELVCFRADPLNTRGEVEFANRQAARRGWTSMLMVPGRAQATRARLLFRRCSDMRLVVVPVSDHGTTLLYDIAYEWAALAKAFVVHPSC